MLSISLSHHASQRSAQRNVSYDEILFIMENSERVHRAGVVFCQLRKKDLPRDIPPNHPYRRLSGTTVVMCKCCHYVITLYRNSDAFFKDRQKRRYDTNLDYAICPYCKKECVA